MIIDIDSTESLKNATDVLISGGVLIFPTDTVYGIGTILSKDAIRKLYKIKNRPANQPTALLMNENQVKHIKIDLPKEFWQGKMTIIFPTKYFKINFPKIVVANDDTVRIRLPKHVWLEHLIDNVGPIVASSANKKGFMAPTKFGDIDRCLLEEVNLAIKSDKQGSGKSSEIYHLELNKILR